MTLLCTHHHRLLHEGAFRIVKQADDSLRFVTTDGRTIPRNGYRLEDFVDDDSGVVDEDAPRGGFCTAVVQREPEFAVFWRGRAPSFMLVATAYGGLR